MKNNHLSNTNSKKIFVLVGTMYPFDRLIKEIDLLGKNHKIFAQIGESNFKPKNIQYKNFLEQKKVEKMINWSDLIICHAGIGTILELIKKEKKIILFPRLKKFGEAIDDHQIEICKAFEKKYGVKWTTNEKELLKLIKDLKPVKINKKNKLVKEIEKIIE